MEQMAQSTRIAPSRGARSGPSCRQAKASHQQPSPTTLSLQHPPEEELVACLRDDLLVPSAQVKTLHLSKLLHAFLLAGGGDHHPVLLQVPAQQHLCRAVASPAGNLLDCCIHRTAYIEKHRQ